MPDAEVEADVREHVAGIARTVRGELDGQACVHSLALGCRAPEIPFGILLGGLASVAVRGRARRQRLEMAASGTAALARRPVEVERDVAELGCGADRAAVEIAVEDEAATHPRPEGEHDHVTRAAACSAAVLRERRRVRVVLDRDGQAEPLAEPIA